MQDALIDALDREDCQSFSFGCQGHLVGSILRTANIEWVRTVTSCETILVCQLIEIRNDGIAFKRSELFVRAVLSVSG